MEPGEAEGLTAAGVYRRQDEHVHGGGIRLADGTRLCCYCDTPVTLTQYGWQPVKRRRLLFAAWRNRRANRKLAENWITLN